MADFDAIVVGSGMSGGWSAKELTERGLKVLLLHRGMDVDPVKDYSDSGDPWDYPNLNRINEEERAAEYPNAPGGPLVASNRHFWAPFSEDPFQQEEDTEFHWIHGETSGGKSLTWARRTYRFGEHDFLGNKEEGIGIDWPIRYADLEPWYARVERFAGISGSYENLPQLPDSVFQKPFELNCVELELKKRIEAAFPTRKLINTRCAHLTEPTEEQNALGRGKCLGRSLCQRGCTYGAYFSSVSATLPAARATGNLTQIDHAIVHSLVYDDDTGRISAVRYIDERDGTPHTATARIVVLNASTVGTTIIMLNSLSERFPNGLANDSGQLGRNIMDHVSPLSNITADVPGFEDMYHAGRAPAGYYIPRFANFTESNDGFLRGYGYQGSARRRGWTGNRAGIGQAFKEANRTPPPWSMLMVPFGEVLPRPENRMYLHATEKNKWGIPIPVFDASMGDNELKMMQQAVRDGVAMLEAAGCTNIKSKMPESVDDLSKMGNRIHEMGTARMGRDPETSVLNGWNQAHAIDNLIVSDGACMTSSACQNPSLTYMAIAARAAHHAADLMEEGVL